MYRQIIRDVPTIKISWDKANFGFIIHDFMELLLKMGTKWLYVKTYFIWCANVFDSGVARILVRRSHSDDTIEEGPGDAPTEMYKKQLYRNRIQSDEKKVKYSKAWVNETWAYKNQVDESKSI